MRRATCYSLRHSAQSRYFYPRSPCGERHLRVLDGSKSSIISIHALLAESDMIFCCWWTANSIFLSTLSLRRATKSCWKTKTAATNFYPRSPCGERHENPLYFSRVFKFLSTLSLRRATAPNRRPCHCNKNFYPRSPCGERPLAPEENPTQKRISIHALLAESDAAPGV